MDASTKKTRSDSVAIDFINSKFGSDVKSLCLAKQTFEEKTREKKNFENQLSLASSEVPNEIEKAIQDAEEARVTVEKLGKRNQILKTNIGINIQELLPLKQETSKLTAELGELERLAQYLLYVQKIDYLSSKIETFLQNDNVKDGVDQFMELSTMFTTVLQKSRCHNMVKFAKDTALFWYQILKNKIASQFEETLKQLKWPLVAMSIKSQPTQNLTETTARMEQLFEQLLKLQLHCLCTHSESSHQLLSNIPGLKSPILPIQVMIKPLRRRFKYHFYGNKRTNDLSKPEWYFTQILNWIRDHLDFLDKKIQPLVKKAGQETDVKLEFMVGMVTLALEKMVADLPELLNADHQFSHLVDEALLFDKEMKQSYLFPNTLPGSLHILCEEKCFKMWLKIEKKFAIEKLDIMMASSTAWQSQYSQMRDIDDTKLPECGDNFMTLLQTITERYKPLPHTTQKLQFLDLQLELLEDFRVRLIQVKENTCNPLGDCYCSILNIAYYIAEVLREWSELPNQVRPSDICMKCSLQFFLQLQYYRMEYQEDRNNRLSTSQEQLDVPFGYTTVFDDCIALYERLKNDMMKTIVKHVSKDVKARGKPYKNDRWISLPYQKEMTTGLSTSACEMLLVLKDHLLEVGQLVSKPLFNDFWEMVAAEINVFIFQEVILGNNFNQGGASQLHFDMSRNLFPLFGEYTSKAEAYFKEVKESCILLNLNVGSALLVREVLNEALHKQQEDGEKTKAARSALKDIGVYKLTLDEAEFVLNRRTNLIL